MKRLFTVTDLGSGNGGKGTIIHKVCQTTKAHTILKFGGAQGGHGVCNSKGQAMSFSQFGCGTFENVATHITHLMVIEPYGLLREAHALKYEFGIHNIWDLITIDSNCLCITPYHTIASRLQELSRKDKPKGTVGIGAGVAVLDAQSYPETAIYAKDLISHNLYDKLSVVRKRIISDLASITENLDLLWSKDIEMAQELVGYLYDETLLNRIVKKFQEVGKNIRIVDMEFLQKLLSNNGTIIAESSHGILTDRYYGFHPNVSRLRTTPTLIWDMLEELDYDGTIFKLGVCRAFAIRDGVGPMVTDDPAFVELLPDDHENNNRYIGSTKVGALDFIALRYAINCCGGPEVFDGIAVTCLDQILKYGKWSTCNNYQGTDDLDLFTTEGEIKVRHGTNEEQLKLQEKLGLALEKCKPIIQSKTVGKKMDKLVKLCRTEMFEKLNIPVRIISIGPTENNKLLF